MALKLIYPIFTKLLSWRVLHASSDTADEIEVLVLRYQLTVMAAHLHGSPRTVEKHSSLHVWLHAKINSLELSPSG